VALTVRSPRDLWEVIPSAALPSGTIVAVVPAALATAVETPRIEARSVTAHMAEPASDIVDLGGVLATPVMSMFQIDSIALRLIMPATWALRSAGAVAWVENVNGEDGMNSESREHCFRLKFENEDRLSELRSRDNVSVDPLAEALRRPVETRNQTDRRELAEQEARFARARADREERDLEARLVAMIEQAHAEMRTEVRAERPSCRKSSAKRLASSTTSWSIRSRPLWQGWDERPTSRSKRRSRGWKPRSRTQLGVEAEATRTARSYPCRQDR
jgi:hypothetical protein